MKFAHLADLHIGAWREPKLGDLTLQAFQEAMRVCIQEKVDFILFSGDLFNTALPSIDHLKQTITELKACKQAGIPIYVIPGSHDFSPSGKTMLDVLEKTDLIINVVKGSVNEGRLSLDFTTDPKTGVHITGMIGKRGALEKHYYEDLDRDSLEKKEGEKIFMFHTSLTELKPKELKEMESSPISMLPKNFNYYAGGHVHIIASVSIPGYADVVYPGPLFPVNFRELEQLEKGGFYIIENWKKRRIDIELNKVHKLHVSANGKTPQEVSDEIEKAMKTIKLKDSIILLRVEGTLDNGSSADIPFSSIIRKALDEGAYHVAKNTVKLTAQEFSEVHIDTQSSEQIEEQIIQEHVGQIKKIKLNIDEEKELARELIKALSDEQEEGEKKYEYDERIKQEGLGLIKHQS